jgi:hypothetical protein
MGFRFRRRVAFGRQLRPFGPLRRWWWRREAAFQGRRDGKLGEPQDSYTRVIGERDVFKQHGDAVLRKIKGAWQKNDALWHAHVLSCDAGRLQRTQDGNALSRLVAETELVVDERAAELEVRLKAERSRGAAERWHIARWIYVLALPCIFAGEIFINAFAFDVLGAVPQNMKYAVAGAISLAVVICAHAVGTLLKTGDITSREQRVLNAALWFPLGLLVALSVLRIMAFKQLDIGTGIGDITLNGPSAGGDSGGSQTNAVIESAVFAVINVVMFIAACVLSFFAYDAYDDAARRARASHRHTRFARWRVSRRWQRAGKRQLKSAYQVNSGIARARGDFAAASTASRMYKDFFEELDARYLRANLRARARTRERFLSRARDRLVAQQRHGGETTAAEPSSDAAHAVLVKPELADEMSKEKQPSWHKSMWVQAASNQDDAAPEQTTNGHVAVATKQERHTARRAASQVPAEAA